jgi:hypothetical protein
VTCAETGQLQGPLALWTVAELLVPRLDDALTQAEGGALNRACVVPGEVAWDECECGTLAISVQRWSLSDDFPEGTVGASSVRTTPCDLPWLVGEFKIQVLRCAPQPTGTSLAPTCDQLTEAARILVIDAYVTLTETVALLCELTDEGRIIDYVLGDQVTGGPEGSCVGTELTVQVGVMR